MDPDAMMQKRYIDELSIVDGDDEARITDGQEVPQYIIGWKLHVITFGWALHFLNILISIAADEDRLLLSLFMSQMESSIISTSVITITNDLGEYGKSTWIFTAYMLTYSGKYSTKTFRIWVHSQIRHAYYLGKTERHIRSETAFNDRTGDIRHLLWCLWRKSKFHGAVSDFMGYRRGI